MALGSWNSKKAVLLIGHGSKLAPANDTLRDVAASVKARGGYGFIQTAFLQIEKPDFQESVRIMASKGYKDIIVMPYFLYTGLHVTKDLPGEIEAAKNKFPELNFTLTRNIGFDDRLIDITVERIEEAFEDRTRTKGGCRQHPIEKESFRILTEELDTDRFILPELQVLKRVIHSTADFDFKDILYFSPNAMKAGMEAIRKGRSIITDVKMVDAGITRQRLANFGSKVFCFSSDRDVVIEAAKEESTKTAVSMRKASSYMEGGIVAIGNAPTALTELLKLAKEGGARPALIVGVPVGFVGAAESKEELMGSGLEYIATKGRKGGSTIAAAIVNAIAIEAAGPSSN